MLVNYIREKSEHDEILGYKGVPIGVVVALDKDHFGYSLCCPKDKWDKKLGKQIAINRAEQGKEIRDLLNKTCERTFSKIVRPLEFIKEKAQRYFKEGE